MGQQKSFDGFKIFQEFMARTPDFESYREEMVDFIHKNPQLDRPELVEVVYKHVKYGNKGAKKPTLDNILGLE